MGFGIALLGYACLILNEVGGAVLAAPLLAYGFFLASRLNRAFLYAGSTRRTNTISRSKRRANAKSA